MSTTHSPRTAENGLINKLSRSQMALQHSEQTNILLRKTNLFPLLIFPILYWINFFKGAGFQSYFLHAQTPILRHADSQERNTHTAQATIMAAARISMRYTHQLHRFKMWIHHSVTSSRCLSTSKLRSIGGMEIKLRPLVTRALDWVESSVWRSRRFASGNWNLCADPTADGRHTGGGDRNVSVPGGTSGYFPKRAVIRH
jgi:hypothetical protein